MLFRSCSEGIPSKHGRFALPISTDLRLWLLESSLRGDFDAVVGASAPTIKLLRNSDQAVHDINIGSTHHTTIFEPKQSV